MWKLGAWDDDPDGVDRSFCWTWIDEFYFAVVTYVTIGYGDVTPHSKMGKVIGALLATFGLITFTIFVSELNDIFQALRFGADKTLLQRLEELAEVLAADDDGTCSEAEYLLFNLKKMGKVDEETLALLRDQFRALDADGSGELDADDIAMLSRAIDEMELEQQGGAIALAALC